MQRLRQQARRRLLGAAVLVGIGIIAFPIVFETQPRPVPMDLPIVIPAKDEQEPPRVAAAELPARLPEAAVQSAVDEPVEPDQQPEQAPSLPRPAAAKPDARLPALDPPTSKPADTARYVVQVGAFADKNAAQAARNKLEAKGLKTYAQVAKTKDGDRIRVRLGPFADRAAAEKAAAQAKAAGLAGAVLTL
ncbi:MAG: SPOR domain-containing protein [Inhella sp.]